MGGNTWADERGFLQPGCAGAIHPQPSSFSIFWIRLCLPAHAGFDEGFFSGVWEGSVFPVKATERQVSSPELALKHRAKPSPALPPLINAQLGERQELPNDSRLRSEEPALLLFAMSEPVSPLIPLMVGGDCWQQGLKAGIIRRGDEGPA